MNIGIDNGYLYTKSVSDLGKHIFKSAYSTSDKSVSGMATIVIDGKEYYVGVGKPNTDTDKTDSEINRVGTLTTLALHGDGEFNIVAGLPIGQYKTQKEKFKKMMLSYNYNKVIFRNKPMNLKINNVIIVPQGVGALYSTSKKDGSYIVFDIGGLTIDVGYIDTDWNGSPTPQRTDTWYKGVVTLYPKIIELVNNKFGLTLEPNFAEHILREGLYILGEKQDTCFLQPLMNSYLDDMFEDFKRNYPCKNVPIYLCGGGATILELYFKQHFPQAILLKDSQFANAIGYYYIAVNTFKNSTLVNGGVLNGK
jgi:plasmid segregation protein ParM